MDLVKGINFSILLEKGETCQLTISAIDDNMRVKLIYQFNESDDWDINPYSVTVKISILSPIMLYEIRYLRNIKKFVELFDLPNHIGIEGGLRFVEKKRKIFEQNCDKVLSLASNYYTKIAIY